MRPILKGLAAFLLATAIASPGLMTGCAGSVRVYDPYYHDYHDWNSEAVYYNRWETENHYQHKDFHKRSAAEQKQYWDWRHSHEQH